MNNTKKLSELLEKKLKVLEKDLNHYDLHLIEEGEIVRIYGLIEDIIAYYYHRISDKILSYSDFDKLLALFSYSGSDNDRWREIPLEDFTFNIFQGIEEALYV